MSSASLQPTSSSSSSSSSSLVSSIARQKAMPGTYALGRVPKKPTTSSYCDHSGWGSKQGSIVKSWKRRYFVLKGIELIYFAERSPSGKGVDEKGRLKLIQVEFTPNFHNAVVVLGALKNQKMIIQLETNDDCKEWFSKIKTALQNQTQQATNTNQSTVTRSNSTGASGGSATKYTMEGWLLKEGQNFKTWKKRYFTLTGTLLQYRAAEREPPLGEVQVKSVNVNASRNFALDIYSDQNRLLRIAADNFESIEAWDHSLAHAIHRKPLFGDAFSDAPAPFLGRSTLLDVDCDGWLYTRGHHHHRSSSSSAWKKKYFTLKDSVLRFSDNPGENARAEGTIIDLKLGLKLLQLEIKLDDGKSIEVATDTDDEYNKWLTALCTVLDRAPSMLEYVPEPAPSGRFLVKAVSTIGLAGRPSERISLTGIRGSDPRNPGAAVVSVRKMGWLRKEGQRMKSWKRRYFVLEGSRLEYYETIGMKVLKGHGDVDRVEQSAKTVNGLDIHFKSGRVLRVTGDTAAEVQEWADTLRGKPPPATTDNSSRDTTSGGAGGRLSFTPGSPVRRWRAMSSQSSSSTNGTTISSSSDPIEFARGWLLKEGKNFKTWKQRYFVLHGASLTYASGVGEPPLGNAHVQHVSFGDARPFALNVQLSNGRLLALVASNEDEFMMWCMAFKSLFEWREQGGSGGAVGDGGNDADATTTEFDHDEDQDQDQGDDQGQGQATVFNGKRGRPDFANQLSLDDEEEEERREVERLPVTFDTNELDAIAVTARFNENMVLCSGWLRKEGGHIKSWKVRFFTLYGTLLRYFKTENGPLLASATIVHVLIVQTRKHCFEITLDSGRKLLVLAECEGEADRWLHALRRAILTARKAKAAASALLLSSTASSASSASSPSSPSMVPPPPQDRATPPMPVRRPLTRAPRLERIDTGSSSNSIPVSGSSSSSIEDPTTELVFEV